jgi:hypothetical protein
MLRMSRDFSAIIPVYPAYERLKNPLPSGNTTCSELTPSDFPFLLITRVSSTDNFTIAFSAGITGLYRCRKLTHSAGAVKVSSTLLFKMIDIASWGEVARGAHRENNYNNCTGVGIDDTLPLYSTDVRIFE